MFLVAHPAAEGFRVRFMVRFSTVYCPLYAACLSGGGAVGAEEAYTLEHSEWFGNKVGSLGTVRC